MQHFLVHTIFFIFFMPNHIYYVVALTDRRQKWRGDSKDELVRSASGCGPKVQCKYPHKYFLRYWYKQLSSDNKSPGLPQSLR